MYANMVEVKKEFEFLKVKFFIFYLFCKESVLIKGEILLLTKTPCPPLDPPLKLLIYNVVI
jgi:hypothetical protein